MDLFPSSNVLALDSRKLSRDPGSLLARAASFLGIGAPNGTIDEVHANRRAALDAPDRVEEEDVKLLAGIFAEDVAELGSRLDFSIEQWPALAQGRGRGKGRRLTVGQAGLCERGEAARSCGSSGRSRPPRMSW
jgi:hypothetical protein